MMTLRISLSALIVGSIFATAGQAETLIRSQSFKGDLCATDSDPENGFEDCLTIPGNVGVPGVYEFMLYGLDPNPQSDAIIRITSPYADLFGDVGENNPGELFRLTIDGVDYGRLFDETEEDEARLSPTLAASVRRNIEAATGTGSSLDLIFTLAQTDLVPIVADGVLSVRFDFREDENVNVFDDPTVLISYSVAEHPVRDTANSGDIAILTAALTAQTAAIHSLTEAVRSLAETQNP